MVQGASQLIVKFQNGPVGLSAVLHAGPAQSSKRGTFFSSQLAVESHAGDLLSLKNVSRAPVQVSTLFLGDIATFLSCNIVRNIFFKIYWQGASRKLFLLLYQDQEFAKPKDQSSDFAAITNLSFDIEGFVSM